jgi:FtsP/CotA-like multicopper oxidase with cupredoxin domain
MKITRTFRKAIVPLAAAAAMVAASSAGAAVFVQCAPGNAGVLADGSIDPAYNTDAASPRSDAVCKHLSAGDGFISMADGTSLYSFGFADVSSKPAANVMLDSLAANFAAPTIKLKQNQDFYLTLTNVSMAMRPDLFDPHTVHFHGYPQAAPLFDGMPEGSFGVNMGSSITYYYKLIEPGTYMYHCHQEATEHMQMGMLGNLYVEPAQDALPARTFSNGFVHAPWNELQKTGNRYVYNDGDGTTSYDAAYPLQLSSMDHVFHTLHLGVQPLPFKNMKDTYAMINGRGYPDTVNPGVLPPPPDKVEVLVPTAYPNEASVPSSQPISALVTATKGQRLLLRLSNLSVTNYYTVTAQGLPMKVVGAGARHLRGPDGKNLYYDTTSVTLGGGESAEVIIDTSQVEAGTYFLYTTDLNYLSNNEQDNGGMMTEIVITL